MGRPSALQFALAAACGLALAAGAVRATEDTALRRAGLWEQTLTLDDGSYAIPPSQMCVDAETEPRLTLVGAQMDRSQCQTYRMERTAGGTWTFRSVCRLGQGATVVTTGEVSGDLRSHYVVRASGETSGAASARMNGTHTIVVDATWRGPCPAGMTGGDVTTGGKTTNVFATAP